MRRLPSTSPIRIGDFKCDIAWSKDPDTKGEQSAFYTRLCDQRWLQSLAAALLQVTAGRGP
jgi:hypothetical protein